MTDRRLSPIEMMIDQATGFKPSNHPRKEMVTLRCRSCKRTRRVAKHETDPPNTYWVEAPCDKCDRGRDKPETMYFDASGQQIHPETGEPFRDGESTRKTWRCAMCGEDRLEPCGYNCPH